MVAHENGGMLGPWVGPATAQKFPCVAKRLQMSEISEVEWSHMYEDTFQKN